MTNTRSSAVIRAELTENTEAYNAAREDAITFERLKASAGKAAALAKQDDELRAELLRAEEREGGERKEATYSLIRNMRVTTIAPQGVSATDSITGQIYRISFEQQRYNSSIHCNEWVQAQVNGFAALTPDQFGYLVDKAANQIPASIMALAPDNPVEALNAFALAMRRGYVRGWASV